MDAYAIFEGGGAKGLAHVGALAAAERREMNFKGVAGASAGAIVAALVACGYRSSDMFDPNDPADPDKIYGVDFRTLLGSKKRWSEYEVAFHDVKSLTAKFSWWGVLKLCRHLTVLCELKREKGFFTTKRMERYLDELLAKKLLESSRSLKTAPLFSMDRTDGELRVRFEHLTLPLKVVATDLTNRRLIVFSQQTTPAYPVAKAVATSICLPFVFKPHSLHLEQGTGKSPVQAVDGGLLSNFPAWLFDEERARDGPHTPTFGFRLVHQASPADRVVGGVLGFGKALISTVLDGDPLLETREIENLHEVPLSVTTGTFDFDLKSDAKLQLFNDGLRGAEKHFDKPGFPRDPSMARDVLAHIVSSLREELGLAPEPLIRANIVCLTTRGTLRVTYSCFMDTDKDPDDRLEFPIGSGACGQCWTTKKAVLCDLVEARKSFHDMWSMDKYQQALVRQDLATLLSYPICSSAGDLLGILNLDSPEPRMHVHFKDERADGLLKAAAQELVKLLQPGS